MGEHRTPRRPNVPATIGLAAAIAAICLSGGCCGETLRDLEYAVVDGISLRIDLYLPDAPPAGPVPLVVWIHGGAWLSGDKS